MINVGLVDDHAVLRFGLRRLLESDADCHVIIEAASGKSLISQLNSRIIPDIILLDINMPDMNGFQICQYLQVHFPSIRIIVLSLIISKDAVINMINHGVSAYMGKNVDPDEIIKAVKSVYSEDIYFGELFTKKILRQASEFPIKPGFQGMQYLTPQEIKFIELCASELSYVEIGERMNVSTKTAENYRDHIFRKLEINSRNALTLFAIRNGIVSKYE